MYFVQELNYVKISPGEATMAGYECVPLTGDEFYGNTFTKGRVREELARTFHGVGRFLLAQHRAGLQQGPSGAFYTLDALVPMRPSSRGERHFLV